ncbi:DUF4349 domain-containing protein [Streptomyces sp. NPDC002680]|uniref:DUF4349 domain-containing protein n=1 Tax=Streptomyces sp. NPDC002680 TaxID=3364659 RepID=UPI003676AE13
MNTLRTSRTRPVQVLAGILLAAALALTGCTGAGDSSSTASDTGGDAAQAAPGALEDQAEADSKSGSAKDSGSQASTAPQPAAGAHIIRTVSVSVQVKDVSKALTKVRTTAQNAGGYVGSETTTLNEEEGEEGSESTEIVLRVPVGEYEEVLADLEGTGKLLHREAEARDVTEQVVDVESRITTQRASVNRIRELMDQATKLSDVVTLEGELSRRQADLESLLARQTSLKDRTTLATINLSLSETPAKESDEDDDPGFLDALSGGWDAFVTMLRWIVVAIAAVLPFAAVAVLLLFVWLRVARLRREHHRAPMTAANPAPATSLPTAPPAQSNGPEQD